MKKTTSGAHKFPLRKCTWELTTLCNLRCAHCGTRAGIVSRDQLTLDKCFSIADELADLGCEAVCLIGGEVTLYPGWDLIADRLISRGVSTNIITNGYRVTTEVFERIRNSRIRTVCVSVDGMEKNHNAIRGKADCFSALDGFIDDLNEKTDKHITASTTLTGANIADIEALTVYLADKNVKIWQLQICSPFGNAKDHVGLPPSKEDVQKVMEIYRRLPQGPMQIQLADNIGYYAADPAGGGMLKEFRGCGAGLLTIGIDSDGNVRGCESMKDDRFIEGNLKTRALRDIWDSGDSFSYNRKFARRLLSGGCADCEYGGVCAGGCRSHNYFSHGRLYESAVCARNVVK